jgi:hypothetical protein
MKPKVVVLEDQSGYALVATLLLLVAVLTLGTASLVHSAIDLKTSGYYRSGTVAMAAAESGVLHALSTINTRMVRNFEQDVVNRWNMSTTLLGSEPREMPTGPRASYSVTVLAHPVDPLNFGVIRSVGEAARESYRAVRVTVRKNGLAGSPGAIYVANDSVSATFNGNSFEIDGNDQTALGAPASTDVTRPGIATRNDGVAETVTNALREGNNGCGQRDQVRGLGYEESSCTPSVVTSPGPTPEQIDRMIDNILEGNAGVVVPWYNRHINGNDVLGTPETPQITHVGGDVQVIGNGNASGAGILIVEGDFTINGGFDFWGWIVVRGNLTVSGSANVRGAIWTSGVQITASGSAAVSYCTECLDLADRAGYGSALGGNIPRTMMVVAWQQE